MFVGLEMHCQSLPPGGKVTFDLLIHIVVVSKRFSFFLCWLFHVLRWALSEYLWLA